jgi:hypothetical protein
VKFWGEVLPQAQKITPNTLIKMQACPKKAFEPLGEGFARKGKRIYFRVQKCGKATWLSTGTDKLPLARRWKEKWVREQWLRESGLLPKQLSVPAANDITVNELLNIYAEAGHPIIQRRSSRPKFVLVGGLAGAFSYGLARVISLAELKEAAAFGTAG